MDDAQYFHRRAEQELSMAAASDIPEAVRVHYTLAGHYLDRCFAPADGDANGNVERTSVTDAAALTGKRGRGDVIHLAEARSLLRGERS